MKTILTSLSLACMLISCAAPKYGRHFQNTYSSYGNEKQAVTKSDLSEPEILIPEKSQLIASGDPDPILISSKHPQQKPAVDLPMKTDVNHQLNNKKVERKQRRIQRRIQKLQEQKNEPLSVISLGLLIFGGLAAMAGSGGLAAVGIFGAVILAALSLEKFKSGSEDRKGKGRALTVLVIGVIGLLVILIAGLTGALVGAING